MHRYTQRLKYKLSKYWLITLLLVAAKLCLHFLTNTNYDLHRDEMLYFNMADHPAFGYVSVPPLTGFFAYLIKAVFGYSVFGIRFIPAILGATSVFIIAKIIKECGGGIMALLIAAVAFIVSPGFLIFDTLFTPNCTEQFLWLLITWLFLRMIMKHDPRIWISIGVLTGISFLNKYSIIFFASGVLIAFIISEHRRLLASKYFFVAVALAGVIVLPNVFWQYNHNWPVVHHMEELKTTQLNNRNYADFFADIYSFNLIAAFICLFAVIALLFFQAEKKYRCMGIASFITIMLFLLLNGKGYYIQPLVPFLLAFGAYAMEKYCKSGLAFINYLVLTLCILSSLIVMPFALPLFSFDKLSRYAATTGKFIVYPFYRWEDGKLHPVSQVYADMTGWKELAGYVAKAYSRLTDKEKAGCTIYCERNYGYAGAIHFYGRPYQLPEPVTFIESYVLWAPDTIPMGPVIYINKDIDGFGDLFADITEIGSVNNKYFREEGLKVFLCKKNKADVQRIYADKATKEKSVYNSHFDMPYR
jgi:hypothetical protein